MKKNLSRLTKVLSFLLFTTCFLLPSSFAQSPGKFSYQAVVRNPAGTLITGSNVGFRISILQGSAGGPVVYAETHTISTNANGLATLEIGGGSAVSGNFSTINWSTSTYFLKTETDPDGGTSYTISGTTQLLSVPYALHSNTAGEISGTITSSQVSDFQTSVTNNSAVLLNTVKNSYPAADATKLAGIEPGAEVNVNADWNAVSGDGAILNKPALFSGVYSDLTGKPTIPTTTGELTNNSGFITSYTETDPVYAGSQAANITSAHITKLSNLSGTNTGDQDLSGLATTAAVASGLDTKVDKVAGKGLSTEDFETAEKTKLAGIADGAEVNVNADWNAVGDDAEILNKPVLFDGAYSSLTGAPVLATVATTGSYNDLTDQPVISASGWSLSGNAGTVDGTDFIGTTDYVPLNFKVNNQKAGRIDPNGMLLLGFEAGNSNYSSSITGIGYRALFSNLGGSSNTAVGASALHDNTTGEENTAIGTASQSSSINGYRNTSVGVESLSGATGGGENVAIGRRTLGNNVTGSGNTAVGSGANTNSGNLNNATAIGFGALVNASNSIQLGNSAVTLVRVGVGNTATVVTGGLHVTGGSPASGKVLTSDASGVASWEAAAGGVNADWNAVSGAAEILNKPTIPTTTSQLTNNSGFLTSYTETDPAFSASQAANITASDITDLSNLSGVNTGDQDLSTLATITALTSGLDTKVDKITGKGLSEEDFTTAEKTKLTGIATGAEINVNADWNAVSGDAQILNKPTIPTLTSQLTNNSNFLVATISSPSSGQVIFWNSFFGQWRNGVLANATTSTNGLMSSTDKTKLDGLFIPNGSETKVQSGTNVTVTGSGTTGSPYIINASGGGGGWGLTGNAGTIEGTNFIGTTDEKPFNIRVNNNSMLFLSTDRKFGLNTITPAQLFHLKDSEVPSNSLDDDMDGEVDETGHEMVFTNSGRFGINTTAPDAELHVAGSVKITDGTQGAGKVLTSDANGMASWQAASGGGPALAIGDSYQGGIIFWLDASGQHGLIAATTDQSTGIQWYNGTYRYTGTTGDGLYAGSMNTAMIVATQMADNQTGNFAAKVCADYQIGWPATYGDWYLPSKIELQLLYNQKNVVGGFANADYWSSTENDNNQAGKHDFNINFMNFAVNKATNTNKVRCIRAF